MLFHFEKDSNNYPNSTFLWQAPLIFTHIIHIYSEYESKMWFFVPPLHTQDFKTPKSPSLIGLKQQTTWNHLKSPSAKRNNPKAPRNHPKLLATTKPPTILPRNEPLNLSLVFCYWLWTWFRNQKSRISKNGKNVAMILKRKGKLWTLHMLLWLWL